MNSHIVQTGSLSLVSNVFDVSYKRKYVHEVLVNGLFNLPMKKCGLVN